jgi:hypothetical protein
MYEIKSNQPVTATTEVLRAVLKVCKCASVQVELPRPTELYYCTKYFVLLTACHQGLMRSAANLQLRTRNGEANQETAPVSSRSTLEHISTSAHCSASLFHIHLQGRRQLRLDQIVSTACPPSLTRPFVTFHLGTESSNLSLETRRPDMSPINLGSSHMGTRFLPSSWQAL